MIILFLLGTLQGLVGWIMVKSGLEDNDRIYVSHYRLAIHFILALGLICYALWFALEILLPKKKLVENNSLKKFTGWMIAIVVVQLIYGAFMAGLKAAAYAPTWPDINGKFLSSGGSPSSGILRFFDNPLMVQFIHRNLGYLVLLLIIAWYFQSTKDNIGGLFKKTNWLPLAIVIVQIILGIFTVLNSPHPKALLWFGVSHQLIAMILLLSLIFEFFLLGGNKS